MPCHAVSKRFTVLVAAVGALAAASGASAQPASVDVIGVVRDFRASHADFDQGAGVPGHYAGNVDMPLDVGGLPVYTGGGYDVSTEWTDSDGNNIAPHLYNVASGSCVGAPTGAHGNSNILIGNQSQVYGYAYGSIAPGGIPAVISTNQTGSDECEIIGNSDLWGDILVGPGGDPNDVVRLAPNGYVDGTLGNLAAPIPVPPVPAPTGMPPSVGNRTYNSGVTQITTDMHFDDLTLSGDARVEIPTGFNVRILVDGAFFHSATGSPTAGLYVEPGASLDLYFMGDDVDVQSGIMEATNEDPSLLRIYMLVGGGSSKNDFDLAGNGARVRAMMWAPDGDLEMTQGSQFWGTFIGREIDLENKCELYVDMSQVGGGVSDVAGAAGAAGGSITSAATYSEWFDDVLGTNLSTTHTVTMTRDVNGVYEYLDGMFYPVDGVLYGNETLPHNYNFTYAVDAEFTYSGCAGQFVEFSGADDMWLFIDGALVMDAGGIQSVTPQYIDLDRLGLTDGQTYKMKLFYAQRNVTTSIFRLRTDLVLSTTVPVNVSAVWD